MGTPEIHAKTRQQIANEYCINARTLYRWMKSAGIDLNQGLINPNDLWLIYKTFGAPQKK
jgi:hypothetical protein